jgi:hypothetical protein
LYNQREQLQNAHQKVVETHDYTEEASTVLKNMGFRGERSMCPPHSPLSPPRPVYTFRLRVERLCVSALTAPRLLTTWRSWRSWCVCMSVFVQR